MVVGRTARIDQQMVFEFAMWATTVVGNFQTVNATRPFPGSWPTALALSFRQDYALHDCRTPGTSVGVRTATSGTSVTVKTPLGQDTTDCRPNSAFMAARSERIWLLYMEQDVGQFQRNLLYGAGGNSVAGAQNPFDISPVRRP